MRTEAPIEATTDTADELPLADAEELPSLEGDDMRVAATKLQCTYEYTGNNIPFPLIISNVTRPNRLISGDKKIRPIASQFLALGTNISLHKFSGKTIAKDYAAAEKAGRSSSRYKVL